MGVISTKLIEDGQAVVDALTVPTAPIVLNEVASRTALLPLDFTQFEIVLNAAIAAIDGSTTSDDKFFLNVARRAVTPIAAKAQIFEPTDIPTITSLSVTSIRNVLTTAMSVGVPCMVTNLSASISKGHGSYSISFERNGHLPIEVAETPGSTFNSAGVTLVKWDTGKPIYCPEGFVLKTTKLSGLDDKRIAFTAYFVEGVIGEIEL